MWTFMWKYLTNVTHKNLSASVDLKINEAPQTSSFFVAQGYYVATGGDVTGFSWNTLNYINNIIGLKPKR